MTPLDAHSLKLGQGGQASGLRDGAGGGYRADLLCFSLCGTMAVVLHPSFCSCENWSMCVCVCVGVCVCRSVCGHCPLWLGLCRSDRLSTRPHPQSLSLSLNTGCPAATYAFPLLAYALTSSGGVYPGLAREQVTRVSNRASTQSKPATLPSSLSCCSSVAFGRHFRGWRQLLGRGGHPAGGTKGGRRLCVRLG